MPGNLGLVYLGIAGDSNGASITSVRGLNETNEAIARSPQSLLSIGPDLGNALPFPKIHFGTRVGITLKSGAMKLLVLGR